MTIIRRPYVHPFQSDLLSPMNYGCHEQLSLFHILFTTSHMHQPRVLARLEASLPWTIPTAVTRVFIASPRVVLVWRLRSLGISDAHQRMPFRSSLRLIPAMTFVNRSAKFVCSSSFAISIIAFATASRTLL
jgi:hypothetical protein